MSLIGSFMRTAMLAFFCLTACNPKSSSTQSRSTMDSFDSEDVRLNEACLEELDKNSEAECDVFIDPLSRIDLYAGNIPVEPLTNGWDEQSIALTQDVTHSNQGVVAQIGNVVSAAQICSRLKSADINSMVLKISLGAEFSNIVMDAAERAVWKEVNAIRQPTVESLSQLSSIGDPVESVAHIKKQMGPYLEATKAFGCSDYFKLYIYYSERTIGARVANIVNDLVRSLPFKDAGYRNNGEPRLVGRAIRNMMVNRSDRGVGLYKNVRDRLIANSLASAKQQINQVSNDILGGTPFTVRVGVHESSKGEFWLSTTSVAGVEKTKVSGGITQKFQEAKAALEALKAKLSSAMQ